MSTKFSPTPAELALVSQIFTQADPQKHGILTGDVAVRVFGGAKLRPAVLGEIWSIADEDNNGWLPRKGVAIAIRLMGWAQKGEQITRELVNNPGPLPTIEGVTVVTQHQTGISLPQSPSPAFPPFTAQEKTKFQTLFNKSGPGPDGLLSGNKARDIFIKSKLSNDTLLQIWNLADTQDRGALDSVDFAIGMYFIQGLMSGQLSFVPTTLPPGLYQQAGGRGHLPNNQGSVRSHMSGNSNSGSFSPVSGIFSQNRNTVQPQHTGQSQLLQPDYTGLSATVVKPSVLPVRLNPSGLNSQHDVQALQWDVSPSDKATSDRFFDELDPHRRGYVEGDVAVSFMLKSNLSGEVLARVWDLADLNNDGKLTREGFAVAMHLIHKKLAGIDIPPTIPTSLIPPSMRANVTSTFSSSSSHHHSEPAKDLLWDDTPPTSAAVSQPNRQTGPSIFTPTSNNDPFSSSPPVPITHHDLLGDDEDAGHTSPPIHDQSAEIGNAQNQLSSTNRALDTLKMERTAIEETITNQASQLSALQTQLSSAKAAYETETKLLATLRERYSGQNTEMQKTREELIRAESDLSAIRVEKSEIEGAFLRDKEDARELHRKMIEVGQQAEALKSEVEKAKKDAKQQKGLLAIARKQLSSKEAERAKAERELEEARIELVSITKERSDAVASTAPSVDVMSPDSLTFAANHGLPVSPDPSSPTGSIAAGKSNNPFDRLSKAPGALESQSPFLAFNNSAISTPSSSDALAASTTHSAAPFDPFGFAEPFETETPASKDAVKVPDVIEATSHTSTPKPVPIDISAPNQPVLSPTTEGESDHFVTPPTTATFQRSQTSSPSPQNVMASLATPFPALEDITSNFPDIQSDSTGVAISPVRQAHAETDLSAQVKDLDVQESDSDNDSEDEVPLAELAKAKSHETEPTAPSLPRDAGISQPEEPPVSFDDIFATTPPTMPVINTPVHSRGDGNDAASLTAPSQPIPNTSIPHNDGPKPETPAVADVSVFDEAMGVIPNSTSPVTQSFTFDSAFDDNFDFTSATEISPPTTTMTLNEKKHEGFDNIFSMPAKGSVFPHAESPTSKTNGHAIDLSPKIITPKPTFDEAFLGFDSGPSLDLTTTFSSPQSSANGPPTQTVFPTSPTPSSPPHTITEPRPNSPSPRPKSPPPRVVSPKPRPSTSSSKETQEKVKEPPTRHSKLSIRLPFGKKKKQQLLEPLPSTSHLTPTQEAKTLTPAVDDDVEAVKQLTAMGFSRSQAVDALEKYGYDVQRALNSLLGAP